MVAETTPRVRRTAGSNSPENEGTGPWSLGTEPLTEIELEFLWRFLALCRNHGGSNTAAENTLMNLVRGYSFRPLTPDDVQRELEEFTLNFNDAVRDAARMLQQYPAEVQEQLPPGWWSETRAKHGKQTVAPPATKTEPAPTAVANEAPGKLPRGRASQWQNWNEIPLLTPEDLHGLSETELRTLRLALEIDKRAGSPFEGLWENLMLYWMFGRTTPHHVRQAVEEFERAFDTSLEIVRQFNSDYPELIAEQPWSAQ
jgi:hypothetical protein